MSRRLAHGAVFAVELVADRIASAVRQVFGSRLPIRVVNYDGVGGADHAVVRGRVLRERPFPLAMAGDSRWRNFRRVLALFLSREVAGARLRIQFGDRGVEAISDEEGYFRAELSLDGCELLDRTWHEYRVECLQPASATEFDGRFRVAGADAEFGVISDIDDTVLETGATRLWFMVQTTVFGNAHTRAIFPGMAELLNGLTAGTTGTAANPLFYVTSSPWNLHDLILRVFALRGVPRAPMFMADWGIDRAKLFKAGHGEHKLAAIRAILASHSRLPFVLIGDSGERDPEIYSQVLKECPDRIRAIYIRDVTPHERDADVQRLSELVAECHAVDLVRCEDSLAAARHSAEAGFIGPEAVAAVARASAESGGRAGAS